jgi:hypothetical protein
MERCHANFTSSWLIKGRHVFPNLRLLLINSHLTDDTGMWMINHTEVESYVHEARWTRYLEKHKHIFKVSDSAYYDMFHKLI